MKIKEPPSRYITRHHPSFPPSLSWSSFEIVEIDCSAQKTILRERVASNKLSDGMRKSRRCVNFALIKSVILIDSARLHGKSVDSTKWTFSILKRTTFLKILREKEREIDREIHHWDLGFRDVSFVTTSAQRKAPPSRVIDTVTEALGLHYKLEIFELAEIEKSNVLTFATLLNHRFLFSHSPFFSFIQDVS